MVEANPWWKNLPSERELPDSYGCVGVKADGGGSMAGRGLVGAMRLHRAANNRNESLLASLLEGGEDPNEVDAAGNTPLHSAAYEGWLQGAQMLLKAGAKVNATNNAGDSPWHFAEAMDHNEVMSLLETEGASKELGSIVVPEHVDKIKDFYSMDEGVTHPMPSKEFMAWREEADKAYAEEQNSLIPGM